MSEPTEAAAKPPILGKGWNKGNRLAEQRAIVNQRVERAADLLALGHSAHDVRSALKIEYMVNWRTADKDIVAAKSRILANDSVPAADRRRELDKRLRNLADHAERDADRLRAIETLIDLYGLALGGKQESGPTGTTINVQVNYQVVTDGEGTKRLGVSPLSTDRVGDGHARISADLPSPVRQALDGADTVDAKP